MNIKIKTKIDIPTISAISEFLTSDNEINDKAMIEVRYFLTKILRKAFKKSCEIENVLPDLKACSNIDQEEL